VRALPSDRGSQFVCARLDALARRLRRRSAATAAAWAATAALAATAGSVAVGAAVGLPAAAYLAVAAAGLAAIAAAGAAGWVRRPGDLYLARLIERSRPDLKNALVTFVELGTEPGSDPSVRAALGRRAARLLVRDPTETYLPPARWRRPVWAVGAAAVALGGVLWIAQGPAAPVWLPQARAGMGENDCGLRTADRGLNGNNNSTTTTAGLTPSREGATTAEASGNGTTAQRQATGNGSTAQQQAAGTPQAPGTPFSRDAQRSAHSGTTAGGTQERTGAGGAERSAQVLTYPRPDGRGSTGIAPPPSRDRQGADASEGQGEPGVPHGGAAMTEALAADAAQFNRLAQALGEADLGLNSNDLSPQRSPRTQRTAADSGVNNNGLQPQRSQRAQRMAAAQRQATGNGQPATGDNRERQATGNREQAAANGAATAAGAAHPSRDRQGADTSEGQGEAGVPHGGAGAATPPAAPTAGDPPLGRHPLSTDAPENVLDTMRRARRIIEKADRADRDGRMTDAFLGRMGLSRSEFRRFVVAWQERFRPATGGPATTLPPGEVRTTAGEEAGEVLRASGSAEARAVVVPAEAFAGERGRLVQEAASQVSPRLRPAVRAYFEAVGRLGGGSGGSGGAGAPAPGQGDGKQAER